MRIHFILPLLCLIGLTACDDKNTFVLCEGECGGIDQSETDEVDEECWEICLEECDEDEECWEVCMDECEG